MSADKAGWDPKKCSATNKKTGEQCGNYPIRGAKTCRFHGSRNKRSTDAAARNLKEKKLRVDATRLGVPIHVESKQGLLDLIARKNGEVAWYQRKIDALSHDDDLIFGTTRMEETESIDGTATKFVREASVNLWLKLKNEAESEFRAAIDIALKHDIDEKKLDMVRAGLSEVEEVLDYVLDRLGLTAEQMGMKDQLLDEAIMRGAEQGRL